MTANDPRPPAAPVVDGDPKDTVRAVQLAEDADWEAIAAWCGGKLINHRGVDDEYATELRLEPSGLGAFEGDWIVRNGYGGVHIVSGDTWPFGEQKPTATALVDKSELQELRDDRDEQLGQVEDLRAEVARLTKLAGEYGRLADAVNRALDVAPFTSIDGLIEALASRPAVPADAVQRIGTLLSAYEGAPPSDVAVELVSLISSPGWRLSSAPSVGSAFGHTVICASLRQREDILAAAEDAWKRGRWVFAPAANPEVTPAEHARIHRAMIAQAGLVVVIRKPDGSLGEAVTGERKYAVEHGKTVLDLPPSVGSDTTTDLARRWAACPACAFGMEHTFDVIQVFHPDGVALLGEAAAARPVSSGGDTDTTGPA